MEAHLRHEVHGVWARGAARGLTVSCAGKKRVLGLEGAVVVRRGLDCGAKTSARGMVSGRAVCPDEKGRRMRKSI